MVLVPFQPAAFQSLAAHRSDIRPYRDSGSTETEQNLTFQPAAFQSSAAHRSDIRPYRDLGSTETHFSAAAQSTVFNDE